MNLGKYFAVITYEDSEAQETVEELGTLILAYALTDAALYFKDPFVKSVQLRIYEPGATSRDRSSLVAVWTRETALTCLILEGDSGAS